MAQSFAFDWVGLTISVASLLFGGGGSGGNLDAAVQQIIDAVEASEADIINHIDAIASAEVQACVEANTIEFADIDSMPPPLLFLWAQNATSCASLTTAYANAVQSPQAADAIAVLIGEIFAIVLAARGKAGLVNGTDLVVQSQMRAYQGVIATLTPNCTTRTGPHPWGHPYYEKMYLCQAYNSPTAVTDTEVWNERVLVSDPVDLEALRRSASAGTNWWDSKASLQRLRTAFPTIP